jgi:hypothetical protein
MNMGANGKMKVIKLGDNGWTCMDPGRAARLGHGCATRPGRRSPGNDSGRRDPIPLAARVAG